MRMHDTGETACLAWLASLRIPANDLRELLLAYHTGEDVYRAVCRPDDRIRDIVPEKTLERLQQSTGPESVRRMQDLLNEHPVSVMTLHDPVFPEILLEITDPVSLLFYEGDPGCLSGRMISMVGSRAASYSGLKAARQIARELSREGVSIVSGFAVGIDTASHQGCLEGGSPTIAVMGCGLDRNYPADNEALRKQITDSGGILVSEYAPGETPLPANFPYRNRIISALGEAVVLMEAKIRSGSLRTVDHALQQGKDVFVYPGDPASPHFEGNHQLLREGGHYFTTARDILEDMDWLDKKPREVQNSGCNSPAAVRSPAEEKVRQCLVPGSMSFEQIAAQSGIPPAELLSLLTIMQVSGQIEALPGKKYQLKQ